MNESRKMINWMAGVTTFVVALLIVIVLLDTEQDGVSLATASRTVALTLESESGILENVIPGFRAAAIAICGQANHHFQKPLAATPPGAHMTDYLSRAYRLVQS